VKELLTGPKKFADEICTMFKDPKTGKSRKTMQRTEMLDLMFGMCATTNDTDAREGPITTRFEQMWSEARKRPGVSMSTLQSTEQALKGTSTYSAEFRHIMMQAHAFMNLVNEYYKTVHESVFSMEMTNVRQCLEIIQVPYPLPPPPYVLIVN
jgi:hypothetical protein